MNKKLYLLLPIIIAVFACSQVKKQSNLEIASNSITAQADILEETTKTIGAATRAVQPMVAVERQEAAKPYWSTINSSLRQQEVVAIQIAAANEQIIEESKKINDANVRATIAEGKLETLSNRWFVKIGKRIDTVIDWLFWGSISISILCLILGALGRQQFAFVGTALAWLLTAVDNVIIGIFRLIKTYITTMVLFITKKIKGDKSEPMNNDSNNKP